MYDFFKRPNVYVIRVPLEADLFESKEEISNFFSFERIGPVIAPTANLALQVANAVVPHSEIPYIDINPDLDPGEDYRTRWGNFLHTTLIRSNTDCPTVIVCESSEYGLPQGGILAIYRCEHGIETKQVRPAPAPEGY
jgi:hypothetical protein